MQELHTRTLLTKLQLRPQENKTKTERNQEKYEEKCIFHPSILRNGKGREEEEEEEEKGER